MNRTESQSPQATNAAEEEAPASTIAPSPATDQEQAPASTKAPRKREPIKSTARDVAGFGVQLGVLARDIKNAEIDDVTPAQRAVIEEMAAGLERLSKLAAEHFGVSDHFGGEDL